MRWKSKNNSWTFPMSCLLLSCNDGGFLAEAWHPYTKKQTWLQSTHVFAVSANIDCLFMRYRVHESIYVSVTINLFADQWIFLCRLRCMFVGQDVTVSLNTTMMQPGLITHTEISPDPYSLTCVVRKVQMVYSIQLI